MRPHEVLFIEPAKSVFPKPSESKGCSATRGEPRKRERERESARAVRDRQHGVSGYELVTSYSANYPPTATLLSEGILPK